MKIFKAQNRRFAWIKFCKSEKAQWWVSVVVAGLMINLLSEIFSNGLPAQASGIAFVKIFTGLGALWAVVVLGEEAKELAYNYEEVKKQLRNTITVQAFEVPPKQITEEVFRLWGNGSKKAIILWLFLIFIFYIHVFAIPNTNPGIENASKLEKLQNNILQLTDSVEELPKTDEITLMYDRQNTETLQQINEIKQSVAEIYDSLQDQLNEMEPSEIKQVPD